MKPLVDVASFVFRSFLESVPKSHSYRLSNLKMLILESITKEIFDADNGIVSLSVAFSANLSEKFFVVD
jgi:hypothetical protein